MPPALHSQEIFLHSDWLINVTNPAASIWAGGNESSGTTNDSPQSQNGICLAESAIGQITAQSAGYPNADGDLANLANTYTVGGQSYRYTNYGNGLITNPAVAWSVVFPSGFNPNANLTGPFTYSSSVASTYISNDLTEADYVLRARLEVNPADGNAAQQLVQLVDAQILPLEWDGTEAMCFSTYARIQPPPPAQENGTNVETIAVELARNYFLNACNVFVDFLGNPFNADLVEGNNPLVSEAVTNQTSLIVEDFLRSLSEYAQASLTDFQLRSFADFYDPTVQGSVPSQPLLSDIDSTVNQVQMLLLLASPFQGELPVYTTGTIAQIRSLLHDMGRLHQSIVLGRVTFSAGASGNSSGDSSLYYGEFTTSFVPFFTSLETTGENSSFDVALAYARQFVGDAVPQEAAASNDVYQVLHLNYTWTSAQVGLQNQYLSQLENLCGTVTDASGTATWADVYTAGLASGYQEAVGPRETLIAQLETNGFTFNETGTIYEQWQSVETAETNLLLATIQLSNTFAMMAEDTLVADAIYSNQVRLAELILTNGQQISAIDVQEGQVQAQADEAIAQIQATAAETEAQNTSFGQLGGLIGISWPPSINPGAFTGAMATLANGYDQASADLQIGSVQAKEATQLAGLNAQIEEIDANEQAQSEYVQSDTTMLNLSANLASLQGQAQAQELQIQLAAQSVDQERSKLANLMSQMGSPIEQWTRSETLVSQNPAFSSNLLIISDATIQQADDSFALAQEWAFLAALCFDYKDNCQADQSSFDYVQSVLKARNSAALTPILDSMESDIALVASVPTIETACVQSSVVYDGSEELQFSLRNNFFQANQVQLILTNGTNEMVTNYEPILVGGTVLTNSEASLGAWTNYLASNVSGSPGSRSLILYFSTSLNAQWVGGVQRNPLFNSSKFGATLYSGADPNQNEYHGVQVSLVTQGFSGNASAGFQILLSQDGTSAIRNRGYCNTSASGPGFRYFNFGAYKVGLTASLNNLTGNSGTASLQDRSPANSQWKLTINEADNGENGSLLFNNLAQLTDIQLGFGTRSYIDQNCQ